MAHFTEEQLNAIYREVDANLPNGNILSLNHPDADYCATTQMLKHNRNIEGLIGCFITVGPSIATKLSAHTQGHYTRVGHNVIKTDYLQTVNGELCLTEEAESYTEDWPVSRFYPIAKKYYILKRGKLKSEWTTRPVATKKALFEGNTIAVKMDVPTRDHNGVQIVSIAKNLDYYGYSKMPDGTYAKPGLFPYHSRKRKLEAIQTAEYRIGFEVEKDIKERAKRISAEHLFETMGWAAEADGSLDNGYELISPVYDAMKPAAMRKDFKKLAYLINGESETNNAGGHITISKRYVSSEDLFTSLEGFAPMLYAMYPKRTTNTYSKVCSRKGYARADRHAAFNLKEGGMLEIRIFPEVLSVAQLNNRARLCTYFMKHGTTNSATVVKRLLNPKNRLCTIIKALGFDPKKLAQDMMNQDAKFDETRYTTAVHKQLGDLGITISTNALLTSAQIKKLSKDRDDWLKTMPEGIKNYIKYHKREIN